MPSPSQSMARSLQGALSGIDSALPYLARIVSDPTASDTVKSAAQVASLLLQTAIGDSVLSGLPEETARAIHSRASQVHTGQEVNPSRAYLMALAERASGYTPATGQTLNAKA